MAKNTGLFDSDDSDIVVNQDYFGVADATSTADDIAVSPGYFGGAISDSELGEIYTLTYDVNTQTIILTDTDGITTSVDAGATEIGFLPIGHDDHSGADNEGELSSVAEAGLSTVWSLVGGSRRDPYRR